MREKDDPKIVLSSLQAHGGDMAHILCHQHIFEKLKAIARKRRQGFGHLRNIPESDKTAPSISPFATVVAGSGFLKPGQKLEGEPALHRGQDGTPAFRNADNGAP